MEREELEYYEKVGAMIAGAAAVLEKDAFNFKEAPEAIGGFLKKVPGTVKKFYGEPKRDIRRALKADKDKRSFKSIAKAFGKAGLVYGGTAGAAGGGAAYLLKKKKK